MDAPVGIDHQHAVGQGLDHQLVDVRLRATPPCGWARRFLLARQPQRQLVGQKATAK
jgi:hypothetical protein